ncbi:MAG: flagellar hook-length control protein FliK [Lachnospiraceae bacterium]|nr:flagellar hook-length control protein FliK [Lachnospiraceae bacterium]
MSGAPVKDIGSLLTFVRTPNTSRIAKDAQGASFGDVMAKAQNSNSQKDTATGNAKLSDRNVTEKKTIETPERAAKETSPKDVKDVKDVKNVKNVKETKDVPGTEEAKDASEEVLTPEEISAINEAAGNVIVEIAKELEVTVEEVQSVMDEMGIVPAAVLDKEVLQDLVTEIKADGEPMALITNEELFNSLQDLNAVADAAIADLAEDMDIEFSDVVEMVEQVNTQLSNTPEMQMSVKADSVKAEVKEAPEITVKVERPDEEVTFTTDDKGNVIKAQTTVVNEEQAAPKEDKGGQDRQSGSESHHESESQIKAQSIIGNGNQMLQSILNTPEEVPQMAEAPQSSFFSEQTQDIMNQIMDNMKINLRPEMDELEMQLHPESLGMVKVNLTNKAGEITAEFKVMNETVKAAMETQLVQLRDTLRDNGVRVESVEVSVDTRAFDQNLYQGRGQDPEYEEQESQRRPRRINLNELNASFEEEATDEEILAAQMMEANGNSVDFQA